MPRTRRTAGRRGCHRSGEAASETEVEVINTASISDGSLSFTRGYCGFTARSIARPPASSHPQLKSSGAHTPRIEVAADVLAHQASHWPRIAVRPASWPRPCEPTVADARSGAVVLRPRRSWRDRPCAGADSRSARFASRTSTPPSQHSLISSQSLAMRNRPRPWSARGSGRRREWKRSVSKPQPLSLTVASSRSSWVLTRTSMCSGEPLWRMALLQAFSTADRMSLTAVSSAHWKVR